MEVDLSKIITVTLMTTPQGLPNFNVNSLGIFTDETPGSGFGTAGYKVYISPDGVATDFGSTSETYKRAVAVFSQSPNVLTGGGYIVVIPLLTNTDPTSGLMQTLQPGALAGFQAISAGSLKITVDGSDHTPTGLNFTHTVSTAGKMTTLEPGAYTVFEAIDDGSFHVIVDGTAHDVTACDFSGVTDLAGVAAVIAAKITAYATCAYDAAANSGDGGLIITSKTTGGKSTVSVLSAVSPGSGTDISGATLMNGLTGALVNGVQKCTTYADVATIIGNELPSADVSYDPTANNSNGGFTFVSMTTGANSKVTKLKTPASGTDITGVTYLNGLGTVAIVDGRDALTKEDLVSAVNRTKLLVYYFGVLFTEEETVNDLKNFANYMQTQDKLTFIGRYDSADITALFEYVQEATLTHTRCLYYSLGESEAGVMAAAYASRLFGINFTGSNTMATMNLKTLAGVLPDPDAASSAIDLAATSYGFDIYVSVAGDPGVISYGANEYSDQIYGQLWLKLAIQVAGYNYLKTTNTKIPQTEPGMEGLKGAYASVCRQGLTNGYLASGLTWTNPSTFGNPEDLKRNVTDNGYYIYSAPIALQSPIDRAARKAPLIQIAAKEAGAIHHSDVIVNVN
jgi:hypothetical protein